eukprot:COSAG05_NODE_775_length_7435_cov_3.124864_6_plen_132_part_00
MIPVGQPIGGTLDFTRNRRRSYDIAIELTSAPLPLPSSSEDDSGEEDKTDTYSEDGSDLLSLDGDSTLDDEAKTNKKQNKRAAKRAKKQLRRVEAAKNAGPTHVSKNVVYLQDMICRYLWSNRLHTYGHEY